MITPVIRNCRMVAKRHAKHLSHAEHLGAVAYAAAELLELHIALVVTSLVIAVAGGIIIILRIED